MRKDRCTKNTVGEKRSRMSKPYFSRNEMNRTQGEDFPGCCLQSQISPSRELWIPGHQMELRDKQNPTEAPPDEQSDDWQPGDKSGYT